MYVSNIYIGMHIYMYSFIQYLLSLYYTLGTYWADVTPMLDASNSE